MIDDFPEEEFAPIAAAMKQLPYFAPSPDFADKVMSRVRIQGVLNLPARAASVSVQPAYSRAPVVYSAPMAMAETNIRRSIPARLAATALVASLGVTMAVVAMVAIFDVNLLVLITRVFGENAMAFLASQAALASSSASATATSTVAAAGTATGLAVAGSFAAGMVAATAVLRAAASASRKAA